MSNFLPPPRARYRLIAYLDRTCSKAFSLDNLANAVVSTYAEGEREMERLTLGAIRSLGGFRETAVPGLVQNEDGVVYIIRAGNDPVVPGSYLFSISPYLEAGPKVKIQRRHRLSVGGRYETVTGLGTDSLKPTIEWAVEAIAIMLETLQQWIEDKLFLAVEDIAKSLTSGVYTLLNEVGHSFVAKGEVDIAVIGRRRGWRLPNTRILNRAVSALKTSPGRYEADMLAATFVATSLPRSELLMSKALAIHEPIVVPFREACYVATGTSFGIACQLLDGQTTNVIHPVYESDGLNVVLIYSEANHSIGERIKSQESELQEFVSRNIGVFETALQYVERQPASEEQRTLVRANKNLLFALDEAVGRAGQVPGDAPSSPAKPRVWRRKGTGTKSAETRE